MTHSLSVQSFSIYIILYMILLDRFICGLSGLFGPFQSTMLCSGHVLASSTGRVSKAASLLFSARLSERSDDILTSLLSHVKI